MAAVGAEIALNPEAQQSSAGGATLHALRTRLGRQLCMVVAKLAHIIGGRALQR